MLLSAVAGAAFEIGLSGHDPRFILSPTRFDYGPVANSGGVGWKKNGKAGNAARPERVTCAAAWPLAAGLRLAATAGGELLNERLHSSLPRFHTANRRKQSAR